MPYEAKAEEVGRLDLTLKEDHTPEGSRARRNGMAYRTAKVRRHLMRMITRQEIPAMLHDHQMQGHYIDERLRLDDAL